MAKLEVNKKAVAALLKDPAVSGLASRARAIASAAGPGFVSSVSVGRTRARAIVITDTDAARRAEAEDRRLSSSIWAGR